MTPFLALAAIPVAIAFFWIPLTLRQARDMHFGQLSNAHKAEGSNVILHDTESYSNG